MSEATRLMEVPVGWTREEIAANVAADIPDGAYVNLGIGMPELVTNHVPEGRRFTYHTENGLLGMGVAPPADQEDPDLINAGKKPVTLQPGASFFHHADSFAMIRGGHIDYCILGAMQVSENGDLANWSTGAIDAVPAVGGAMDLVAGVKNIFIATLHRTKSGQSKLVRECSYPLTGAGIVKRVYTDLAVIEITEEGFLPVRLAPKVTYPFLCEVTEATLLPLRET